MQQYEIVIVLTPLLSDETSKEVIAKFNKFKADGGAEIVQEDNWGLKKLAYPIQKKSTGYYHLTEFRAPGELINKLEIELRRDERVLRRRRKLPGKNPPGKSRKRNLNGKFPPRKNGRKKIEPGKTPRLEIFGLGFRP